MRLENKVAIITGGASGMGRGAAEIFAREGCSVSLAGRRKSVGESVASQIRENGGSATFIQADVSISKQVENLIDETINCYGEINILFNNAGINNHVRGNPDEEDEEEFDKVISVNLKGAFLCTKFVVPKMIEIGGGSIINNSSVLDAAATHTSSTSYHLSKGGMAMLTKKTCIAYAKYNIRVNTIQPGAIATEMSKINWDDLENHDIISSRKDIQPLHLMGHPYDVGYAALYFASDESKFVTGSSLLVDGGMSASIA